MLVYLALIDAPEDRNKFELVYQHYRGLMFYIARGILDSDQDAEDAVHDAFLKIAEHIEQISQPLCPKTRAFVVIIVERKALDLYRRKNRRAVLSLEEESIHVPSPSRLDGLEGGDAVSRAIAALPIRYRELILLKYDQGFDDREVARLMGMTRANVSRTIQRAKKLLQTLLEQEGVEL